MNDYRNKSVLIFDRDYAYYRQLVEELKKSELKVIIENEPTNILTLARSINPDIILFDISARESEKIKICQQIKSNLNTKNISLIIITYQARSLHQLQTLNYEGVDYINKPAQLQEILVRIKTHLALRQIDSQLQQEISNRHHIEALLEQSQQLLARQNRIEVSSEIPELEKAKDKELLFPDRELEEFVYSLTQDLQTLSVSLATFSQYELEVENEIVQHLAEYHLKMQSLVRDLLFYTNTECRET